MPKRNDVDYIDELTFSHAKYPWIRTDALRRMTCFGCWTDTHITYASHLDDFLRKHAKCATLRVETTATSQRVFTNDVPIIALDIESPPSAKDLTDFVRLHELNDQVKAIIPVDAILKQLREARAELSVKRAKRRAAYAKRKRLQKKFGPHDR